MRKPTTQNRKDVRFRYYIPENFDPSTAQYLIGIHGAGDYHWPGARTKIDMFKNIANEQNLVLIAPAFDAIFTQPPVDEDNALDEIENVQSLYLWDFVIMLNGETHKNCAELLY